MSTSNDDNAAEAVLKIRRTDGEAKVQSGIQRLIEAHDVYVTPQYRTPGGPVDLYCHNRRLLLEVKAAGKATDPDEAQARVNPESPKEQLERYLRSEIERELSDRAHSRFPGHALTPTGVMAIRCKQFHLPDL